MPSALNLCVMLGDVINSRTIDDRASFGRTIQAALQTVNREYTQDLYTEFDRSRGIDEIGGALTSITNAYRILKTINTVTYPYTVRFVLVLGEIDVESATNDITKLDGPAFHHADALLQSIEQNGLFFGMDTGDDRVDTLVANQINLIYLLRSTWTEKQTEAMATYERAGSQSAAADVLGVTQQTLSERLRAIHWKQVTAIENTLNDALAEYSATLTPKIQT